MPVATAPFGQVPRYAVVPPVVGMDGDVEAMAMYAGHGVGAIALTEPAAEIVDRFAAATREENRDRLGSLVRHPKVLVADRSVRGFMVRSWVFPTNETSLPAAEAPIPMTAPFEDLVRAESARLFRALYLITGNRHESEEVDRRTRSSRSGSAGTGSVRWTTRPATCSEPR